MINGLSTEFSSEIRAKQEGLAATQTQLRASTRSLADQRRQIQSWQHKCGELDQVHQRMRNLEKALAEEDKFDWTGRTETGVEPKTKGPFAYRGVQSTLTGVGFDDLATHPLDVDPALPTTDSPESLVRMRRMNVWYARTERMMETRLRQLQGASADKEFQCKKIVSLCTAVPMDQIEQVCQLEVNADIDGRRGPRCSKTWWWPSRVKPRWWIWDVSRVSCKRFVIELLYSSLRLMHNIPGPRW